MLKQAVLNDMAEMYATNRSMVNTFMFLNKYKLPYDYAHQRALTIQAITLDEVKEAAHRVLRNDALVKVRVGRLDVADVNKSETVQPRSSQLPLDHSSS